MTMFNPGEHLVAQLRSLHLFPPSLHSLSHLHLHPLTHGVSIQEAGTKQEVTGLEQEKEREEKEQKTPLRGEKDCETQRSKTTKKKS